MAEQTALQQYHECDGNWEDDPLERLRFFCSLAMNNQDWIDVEPFFDAVKEKMVHNAPAKGPASAGA